MSPFFRKKVLALSVVLPSIRFKKIFPLPYETSRLSISMASSPVSKTPQGKSPEEFSVKLGYQWWFSTIDNPGDRPRKESLVQDVITVSFRQVRSSSPPSAFPKIVSRSCGVLSILAFREWTKFTGISTG